MKKIMPLFIVGILVLSGLGAVAFSNGRSETIEITESVSFSGPPVFQEINNDGYLSVSFEEANSELRVSGKPELPIYIQNYQLPKNAKNIQVTCTPNEINSMHISGEIAPTKIFIRDYKMAAETTLVGDKCTYDSIEFYPDSWSSIRVSSGRNDNDELVKFVDVICHVVRYSPAKNIVEYVSGGVDINVKYECSDINPIRYESEYDMVIIAPAKFEDLLQPLIDHKNSHGVITMLKTVDDILIEYDGYDAPEQIKYFIKDALDNWNITYVLLVGGLKSYINADDKDDCNQGTTDWHVPVRYANIRHSEEVGCISDLYYGDIYDAEGNFSSWDSNGDGVYAKLPGPGADDLDLTPEVFVGRLACRNKIGAKIVVNKIIRYESTPPDSKKWFKTMVGVAGKTFDLFGGQPDGEYVCDAAIDHMGALVENPVRVYASNRDSGGPCPIPKDIRKAINQGAGYINFQGHGNPVSWNTIWHDGVYPDNWTGGTNLYKFWTFLNGRKLPVVIVGGCHNALFNVSLIKSMDTDLPENYYWTYGMPAPVCFCWGL